MNQIFKNCNKAVRLLPCQMAERKVNQHFKNHFCPFFSELNPRQDEDGFQNTDSFAFQTPVVSGRPREIYCIQFPSKLQLLC